MQIEPVKNEVAKLRKLFDEVRPLSPFCDRRKRDTDLEMRSAATASPVARRPRASEDHPRLYPQP